ncbi:MAG TPA: AI-2E family transporter [Gemmatimonadales bacterium]|nr:AI-2E family transporter [Gemmatimonadales bacterium]
MPSAETPRSLPSARSSTAIRLIAAILVITALAVGREFFLPVALALCFHALLRPLVRSFERMGVPSALGATVVVLGLLGIMVVGGFALSGPVSNFVERAPTSITTAREKLRAMGRPFTRVSDAASGQPQSGGAKSPPATSPTPAPAPAVQPPIPPAVTAVLGSASLIVAGLVEVLLILFLMLAAGDMLFRKLVKVVPGPDEKRTVSDVFHQTESIVARYLIVTAIINIGQGIAVGLAMWAIGMPDPFMWGLLTFALEFIPYLGGAINVGLLLITGFTVFSGVGKVLLAPALYLVITTLQNNVVSPYAYGGRLKLSPLAVLLFALFWWFIWGIPGAFLSIPIAATLKVLGDQVPRLAPLGELLGE